MECPQGALASGLLSETVTKMVSVMDDFSAAHGVSGDDLFVDELLDFSNDLSGEEGEEEEEQKLQKLEEKQPEGRGKACPVPMEKLTAPEGGAASVNDDFGPLPETELSVAAESLESLEWLSHFVEDSFSDYCLTGILLSTPAANRNKPDTKVKEQACFMAQLLTRARTKRARTGVRVWSVLSPSFTESSSSSSSSTTSFSFLSSNSWAVQGQTGEPFCEKPPLKKQKKKPSLPTVGGGVAPQPRRCSHCGVTKTPQWRAGPLGSKTLCNACGVRFKSGRLLPEYRPACSPTFSSDLHSNNHRKVLEMRQKKKPELETVAPPVQSF